MSKSIYTFAILFLGLAAACGLLQGIIYLSIGSQLFFLPEYIAWFFVSNIIVLAGSLFLLKYYQYRKYWFAFWSASIVTTANLFLALVFFRILMSRAWASYYTPALLVFLGAAIIHGIALIFSATRKSSWLKTAGIALLIITLVLVVSFIWSISGPARPINGTLEKITLWAQIAGNLVPVLYIMQFLAELKIIKKEKIGTPERESVKNILGFAGLIASIGAVAFGAMLASAWYSQISWNEEGFEITKNWVQTFEARVFVNDKGDTLFYRLLKPLNYDPQKKYPLVVSLPYGGQPGTDKIRQVEGAVAAELLSNDANRTKYPAFIFVPNCPPGSGWGGIPGYPSVDTLVYKAIEAVDKAFPIDVKRQYVTGLSRGGYGSWNFICTRPDLFAAAVPVSGAGDPKLASKIVDIPVWAFHGAQDHNVPVNGSREMISAIKKAGGKPKYTEYPNAGHDIWDMASQTPGLWDWLFAQQRR